MRKTYLIAAMPILVGIFEGNLFISNAMIVPNCLAEPSQKDYGAIAVNDGDRQLLEAWDELKEYRFSGYASGRYPKLEKLSENLKLDIKHIPVACASFFQLAAFKVEKEYYNANPNYEDIAKLQEIAIRIYEKISGAGFPQIAITYIFPGLQTIKRILASNNVNMSDALYDKLHDSLLKLDKLIAPIPAVKENHFRENALLNIRINLILLEMQKFRRNNKYFPLSVELEKQMNPLPTDPYDPKSAPLLYACHGSDWYIKSLGINGIDDGYDGTNYCPLPLTYTSGGGEKDMVFSFKTGVDLNKLWSNGEITNRVVKIVLNKNNNGWQITYYKIKR